MSKLEGFHIQVRQRVVEVSINKVRCPKCGAEPGQRCTDEQSEGLHTERIVAASLLFDLNSQEFQ